MNLKTLSIYPRYGQEGYRTTAEFNGPRGEVKIELGEDLGRTITALCIDEIHAAVQQASTITKEELMRGPGIVAKEIEHEKSTQ